MEINLLSKPPIKSLCSRNHQNIHRSSKIAREITVYKILEASEITPKRKIMNQLMA